MTFSLITWFESFHLFPAGTLMDVTAFPHSAHDE